ncbi:MAG TPA: type II toxin-antitoxin system HipA family toxin [Arcobacter sp.]|nr:type II toxin-antitoxin system HipA family toxin [Arcobacter sp.]
MKIYVLKQGKPLGYLEEKTFGKISFTYLEGIDQTCYIQGITQKENFSNELFLVFENMFPENEQIDQIKAQNNIKTHIELLLYLNDIHGSYTFITEDAYETYKESSSTHYQYSEVIDEVLENDYVFPNILNNYTLSIPEKSRFPDGVSNSKVIGLSGFQYKFSVTKDDLKKEIRIDEKGQSQYFMKPYNRYYTIFSEHEKDRLYIPYLLINEHLFMTLARDSGFQVPYNAIIKDGEDYHYIIKRYDRYKNEKFDHEEFATMLGYNSDTKYDASVQEVFKVAKEFVSNDKIEELLLFFYFSTIIGHGDLHSKNISLIHSSNAINEEGKHLSPYYDISTTHIYRGLKDREIGLKLLGRNSKIKKEHFLNLADKFGIDLQVLEDKMRKITNIFVDKFPAYIEALPSEILDLPFHRKYGNHTPLKGILEKYYEQRKTYILKYIDKAWIQKKDIADIFK